MDTRLEENSGEEWKLSETEVDKSDNWLFEFNEDRSALTIELLELVSIIKWGLDCSLDSLMHIRFGNTGLGDWVTLKASSLESGEVGRKYVVEQFGNGFMMEENVYFGIAIVWDSVDWSIGKDVWKTEDVERIECWPCSETDGLKSRSSVDMTLLTFSWNLASVSSIDARLSCGESELRLSMPESDSISNGSKA